MAWCKEHGVPVEKLFSKTLMTKCTYINLLPCLAMKLTRPRSPLGNGGGYGLEVLTLFLHYYPHTFGCAYYMGYSLHIYTGRSTD